MLQLFVTDSEAVYSVILHPPIHDEITVHPITKETLEDIKLYSFDGFQWALEKNKIALLSFTMVVKFCRVHRYKCAYKKFPTRDKCWVWTSCSHSMCATLQCERPFGHRGSKWFIWSAGLTFGIVKQQIQRGDTPNLALASAGKGEKQERKPLRFIGLDRIAVVQGTRLGKFKLSQAHPRNI